MRLIDAEELEGLFNKQIEQGATDAFDAFDDALQDTPTVDAEVVVRCKDCKHHYDCGVHFCNRLGMDCPDDSDFFCSYGERKDCGDAEG